MQLQQVLEQALIAAVRDATQRARTLVAAQQVSTHKHKYKCRRDRDRDDVARQERKEEWKEGLPHSNVTALDALRRALQRTEASAAASTAKRHKVGVCTRCVCVHEVDTNYCGADRQRWRDRGGVTEVA